MLVDNFSIVNDTKPKRQYEALHVITGMIAVSGAVPARRFIQSTL